MRTNIMIKKLLDGENEDGESYKGVVCDRGFIFKFNEDYACKYDE